jgi:X-X-X-Leu-X-X-Gly heptad repeat protein
MAKINTNTILILGGGALALYLLSKPTREATTELIGGAGSLASGVGNLARSGGQFLEQTASGIGDLTEGAGELASGLGQLGGGVASFTGQSAQQLAIPFKNIIPETKNLFSNIKNIFRLRKIRKEQEFRISHKIPVGNLGINTTDAQLKQEIKNREREMQQSSQISGGSSNSSRSLRRNGGVSNVNVRTTRGQTQRRGEQRTRQLRQARSIFAPTISRVVSFFRRRLRR